MSSFDERQPLLSPRPIAHSGAPLGPIDAFWHLVNFVAPALGVAALASALAKLIWRKALRTTRWWLLFYPAAAGGVLSLALGLLLWERDGRMATYALLVFAVALSLWWRLMRVSSRAS